MNRIRPVVVSALALVAVASLSACGEMADGAQGPQHGEPGHKMLQVGTVNGVGSVVTDADGKTLYRFDKDISQPPTSNCDGDCTKSWPPMLAGVATPMLKGIQDTQVGTATRKDGSKQIRYAFKAVNEGTKLTKFASKEDWDALDAPVE